MKSPQKEKDKQRFFLWRRFFFGVLAKEQYSKKFSWPRFGLFLSIWVSLALLFHFREEHLSFPKFGEISDRYVIADTTFSYPDHSLRHSFAQEKAKDIGSVHKLSAKQCQEESLKIFNDDAQWRSELESVSIEDTYLASRLAQKYLEKVRVVDERTFQILKKAGELTDFDIIGNIQNGKFQITSESFWYNMKKKMVSSGVSAALASYFIDKFHHTEWVVLEDLDAQFELRNKVEGSVPLQYREVAAGEKILSPGEKVSKHHMERFFGLKKALKLARRLTNPYTLLGNVLLAFFFTFSLFVIMRIYFYNIYKKSLPLLTTVILFVLFLAKTSDYFLWDQTLFPQVHFPVYVVIGSLFIALLMHGTLALIVSGFLAFVLSISLAVEGEHFLVINLFLAIFSIIWVRCIRKRREIFTVCLKLFLLGIIVIGIFSLIESVFHIGTLKGDIYALSINLLLIGVLFVALLPLVEALFHTMTDMRLLEWMDPTHELLERLSKELPGTYQHSLMVANLASSGAKAIDARVLLCYAGALYHDIGKLANPSCFSENQQSGFNVHSLMQPIESAQTVIRHVADGVDLAYQYKLPELLIDHIRQHHGTTMTYTFYRAEQSLQEELVDKDRFRYPGPKPESKEAAILMLADSLEAASRGSTKPIEELAEDIFCMKVNDHQFSECDLTLRELEILKKDFISTLKIAGHRRQE